MMTDCSGRSSTLTIPGHCWTAWHIEDNRRPSRMPKPPRLAEMHDFEEQDAMDEDYGKLVAAITTIRDSCKMKKPKKSAKIRVHRRYR
ncbi:hypothetical protein Aduo_012750 [Ancylostoma duodenale]